MKKKIPLLDDRRNEDEKRRYEENSKHMIQEE